MVDREVGAGGTATCGRRAKAFVMACRMVSSGSRAKVEVQVQVGKATTANC